jgi:hypothetical protein
MPKMDKTFSEWGEHLTKLSHEVSRRWPMLSVSVDRETCLRVQIRDVMGGAVELDLSRRANEDCLIPNVRVGSSGGLPSDLSVAQAKLNDMRIVLDALHYCNAACADLRLFPEGKCPCAQCSGRGYSSRSDTPCGACKGKGVR